MTLSEITPTAPKIDRIMNRIEEGDIKIPAFQRGFVWNQEQVLALLDSIYRDYPIGSILLWKTSETLKSTRNIGGFLIPEREPEYPVNYVLDGQQRLATIYAIFCKDRGRDPQNVRYDIDPDIFEIYFDLDDDRFVHDEDLVDGHANLKMTSLLDADKFFDDVNELNKKYRKKARDLQSKFMNYEIPVVTTAKRSKEEVGTIFERINNTGTRLTTLDLMVAWTWGEEFHLREELDQIKEILDSKGFGETPDKIVLQCLAGIIEKTTKTKDIIKLKPETVRKSMDKLNSSLEKSIDFLSTELNVISRDFLPHSHQIVPLTFFFSRVNTPNQEQSKTLKQWFWKTSFSKRYSGSTDKKMNDDIAFFEKVVNGDYLDIQKYSYSVDKSILMNQKFSQSSPFTRAFLLLLAQNNPLNLVNGNRIDLGTALSKYNSKEFHHIFPRTFLKNKGVETEKINSLCNFSFIPADSNKAISGKSPSDYIFNVIPSSAYSKILDSNLMPPREEIYQRNQYDTFLQERATLILQHLDSIIVS
ncbi:DUF262 domain-containing protein [Chloroflexota bacterium]